jgi:hypothetical protein
VRRFYYFGCRGSQTGHHLHSHYPDGRTTAERDRLDGGFPIHLLDGTFAPLARDDRRWKLTHLSLNHHVLSILAKHDYTIDTRPGSNACFVMIDETAWDEWHILAEAKICFPDCWERLTK